MKRKLNTKTSANKTKCAILLSLMICLSFFAGCQNVDYAEFSANDFSVQFTNIPESNGNSEQNTMIIDSSDVTDFTEEQTIPSESNSAGNEAGDNNMAQEGTNSEESEQFVNLANENAPEKVANEYTIEGFAFVDGMERSVCVTLSVEGIQRGEEAFKILQEYNSDITSPNENEEYIIATFNVSYDSGEIEELYMMENRASLEQARLYFALSNGQSNAYDVTSYLSNSIYDISLTKGQSAQGTVAFLQEKGNTEPLVFVGFEQIVKFNISY